MRAFPSCCVFALIAASLWAAEPTREELERPFDPITEAIAVDFVSEGGVAGDPCPASPIGGYNTLFSGPNRFRGNMIQVPNEGNEIRRFAMELNIPAGLTQLTFWVLRRNDANSFDEVASVTTQLVGINQAFYWSPVFNPYLELIPNVDYVLGISWPAVNVTYGRDALTYPRPFSNGTVRGSVGVTGEFNPPVVLGLTTNGAYSMRICFSPLPGSCCVPSSQSCVNGLLQDECELEFGGFFQGQSTSCLTSPCNFGVCCTLTGECLPDYILSACTAYPGNWHDVDSCNQVTCPILAGACCMGTSCIDSVTQAECSQMTGLFRGNGTRCNALHPDCGKGACCSGLLPNGCAETTLLNCGPDLGTFQGLHTRCIDSIGMCPGRCCVGAPPPPTSCLANRTPDQCADLFGVFIGFGTGNMCEGVSCSSAAAGPGRCCLPNGDCVYTNQTACVNNLRGQFTAGQTCAGANACPGVGACCKDSLCLQLTQQGCNHPTWQGTFLGVGTPCTSATCAESAPGACCVSESCLSNRTNLQCAALGGTFQGPGSSCSPITCEPIGACCEPDGDCLVQPRLTCLAGGNTFQGANTTCVVNNCPQPQYACCRTGAPCVLATTAQCSGMGGVSQVGVTSCATAGCPAACCLPAGSCVGGQTPNQCTGLGGQYQGDGTACGAGICPTGACCSNQQCLVRTQFGCTGLGGQYQGNGSSCAPDPCAGSPIQIVSSVPPNNSIDARQPFALPGCPTAQGVNLVVLTFDGPTASLTAGDFAITTEPAGAAPAIANVIPGGDMLTVVFTTPIPQLRWTRITHVASGTSTRLGFLPGDVNNDRTSNPIDILKLIDHLNGVESYAIYQTDVDRSSATNPADVLRVIDLLNGADCYDPYNGAMLPP